MYDSPIDKIIGEMKSQMVKDEEGNLMVQVSQTIGYNIDKDELIKALNYDRQQYEKGYEDGLNASKWIPVTEKWPEKDGRYWVTIEIEHEDGFKGYQTSLATLELGTFWVLEDLFIGEQKRIVAWMPCTEPEPWEGR